VRIERLECMKDLLGMKTGMENGILEYHNKSM